MKQVTAAILLSIVATMPFAKASHPVKGYTKKDGAHVARYHATNPDRTRTNNFSAKGNINPYTGKEGTKNPYASPPPDMTQTHPERRSPR
jgi:hypothetical protein